MNIFCVENKQYISRRDAAYILKLKEDSLTSAARNGNLRTIKVGRTLLFDYEQVLNAKKKKKRHVY